MQKLTRVAFAAIFLLGSTPLVFSQSSVTSKLDRKQSDRWSGSAAPTEPQRLFVVIEANAGKKATDIHQIVKLGLEHLRKERKFEFEDISVSPVSGTLYKGMKALFRGETFDPDAVPSGLSVRLLPGGKSTWEVYTGGPFVRAKSLTVFFEKDEEGKIITLAPSMTFATSPVNAIDQNFRFHSPGIYILSLDSELVPSRYEIEIVSEKKGESEPEILKANWPQDNLYYLLLIDKLVGDRRVLFETLKNNRVVGNGLKDVQTVESATISLATFVDSFDNGTSGWDDENHYYIRIKKPDDKFPKRAWMLFPVDAETAKSELSRLKNICSQGAEEREKLLEEIRSSAVLADDSAPLKVGATPSWYEIPSETKDTSGFSRLLEVAPDSETTPTSGQFIGLCVFEFNEQVMLSVGNSYVQEIDHPRWADGIHKLYSSSKRKPE